MIKMDDTLTLPHILQKWSQRLCATVPRKQWHSVSCLHHRSYNVAAVTWPMAAFYITQLLFYVSYTASPFTKSRRGGDTENLPQQSRTEPYTVHDQLTQDEGQFVFLFFCQTLDTETRPHTTRPNIHDTSAISLTGDIVSSQILLHSLRNKAILVKYSTSCKISS